MSVPSKFSPSLHGDRVTVSEEIEIGDQTLRAIVERVDRVIMNGDNHTARLYAGWLQSQLTDAQVKRLLMPPELLDKIAFTTLGYLNLNRDPARGRCGIRITHPGNASIIPTAVSADIASQVQMHVVSGHGHTVGYRRSRGNHYWVIDSGGLFDPARMGYLMVKDRRRPLVNQGFVVVIGNRARLIDPLNVDWDEEFWLARHRPDDPMGDKIETRKSRPVVAAPSSRPETRVTSTARPRAASGRGTTRTKNSRKSVHV